MSEVAIRNGFLAAGIMNIGGVLFFSRGLTNLVFLETDPVVMGMFGSIMILVWGLTYISVATTYHFVPWLVAVFAVEKMIYGSVWSLWINAHLDTLGSVYAKDLFAGIFYSIYGINDWIFAAFFGWVFLRLRQQTRNRETKP